LLDYKKRRVLVIYSLKHADVVGGAMKEQARRKLVILLAQVGMMGTVGESRKEQSRGVVEEAGGWMQWGGVVSGVCLLPAVPSDQALLI
jgi:hypothetical protein